MIISEVKQSIHVTGDNGPRAQAQPSFHPFRILPIT